MQSPSQRAATARPLDSCALVIFGATGDLAARKLFPALYDLFHLKRLPEKFYVLGVGRKDWSAETFRQHVRVAASERGRFGGASSAQWEALAERLHYEQLDASQPGAYERLRERLGEHDKRHSTAGNRVFYLSVPPELYSEIVENLGRVGLASGRAGWTRVIVEKPFGRDAKGARALNRQVQAAFQEEQVYRIDHYLGKETVQNLVVFRFANAIFEPLWNRNHIDHIQITVAEDLGVEHRASFYERSGAVRDMIQNHLLQLLCLVAMEPPASFEATPVQREKLKVLQSLRPLHAQPLDEVAVRGQYGPGRIRGEPVSDYPHELGVKLDSTTETFAALQFEIANWRWAGVPFFLRTGKRLPRKASEISIQFREAPLQLFACTAMQPCVPNLLRLRLQPDEGIDLRFIAKEPGLEVVGRAVEMDFSYGRSFGDEAPSDYGTLLLDCLEGERMLFARADWVEAAWDFIDPLLNHWAENPPKDFPNYAAGIWGPAAAQRLIDRSGRHWHLG